jgi:transcriptional regulator with XRE-family HTH domain
MAWLRPETVVTWEALERLGATARRARLAHHWTQQHLAEKVELDQTSISLFERGRFPGLRLILFIRMATELRLDIEALAPRELFVVDAVVEALRVARLEAEGRVCPSCRSILRTPIRTNP